MRPDLRSAFSPRAFTVVEALVVLVVSGIVFFGVQSFFSHGVRNTLKGQDTLDTIRIAGSLLSQIRKDISGSTSVRCAGADGTILRTELSVSEPFDPTNVRFGNHLDFRTSIGTISYNFDPDGRSVIRKISGATEGSPEKKFVLPKVRSFEVAHLLKEFSPDLVSPAFPRPQEQLLIRFRVLSDDPRFPAKEMVFSSFFTTSQLQAGDWNYYLKTGE